MKRQAIVAALMVLSLIPASAVAQSGTAAPRGPDGKPDLSGVWQGGSTVRGSWDDANSGFGVGGSGKNPDAPPVVGSNERPAGREGAPYQEWAAKKVRESFNKRAIDDPTALCLPPGVPRSVMLGLFPQKIVQTPKEIVVLYEYMNTFRMIPLNAKHPDDVLASYMGDSVGHWEGDTLVVDVIGFNDKTWLAGTGTFHSEALHVTERYTRVDRDRIDYEVTMDDPKVFTKPWTLTSSLMLREGTRVQEYVCAENNLDPANFEQLLKAGAQISR
jgi:hypothetical protein